MRKISSIIFFVAIGLTFALSGIALGATSITSSSVNSDTIAATGTITANAVQTQTVSSTSVSSSTVSAGTSITTPSLGLSTNAGGSTTNGVVWFDGTNFYGYTGGVATQLNNAVGGGSSSETYTFFTIGSGGSPNIANLASAPASTFSLSTGMPGVDNAYLFVPHVSSSSKTITAARIFILSRSGSYGGNATVSIKTYDASGNLQHTVSSAAIDLEAAPVGSWQTISLSGTAADKVIDTNEFTAFHLNSSVGTADNLAVKFLIALTVE